ncbi:MAG: nicotinamide-nucleotide amidohydrolase family protein [Planctomycetota bacterium]|nr:nicotinamide-nucleotide amidohydrolase family protein [Planctomycetota bacterium]MDA1114717.1 nicotinamide-nucleotide amidohydrolase family protein [Planctomycetota bacterium]
MPPPTAIVISIGEELLEGRIQDTNASTFAAELLLRGFHVVAMHTVGDGPGELKELLQSLQNKVDVILTTGGLGPTEDDRVRQEVAALLGVELVSVGVDGAVDFLHEVFARFQPGPAPDFFLAQALIPAGATPLSNKVGTAWGFHCTLGQRTELYVLPGPPRECAACFFYGGATEDLALRFGHQAHQLAHAVLHTTGAAESVIEKPIRAYLRPGENPRLGITASANGVCLSLLARAEPSGRSAGEILEARIADLQQQLHPFCWGRDADTLASVVVRSLASAKQTLALAESCTGGLLAGAITDVSGSSSVFTHGWVTYANRAKVDQLGVDDALLEGPHAVGAVSEEVALQMAQGARQRAGSDWGVGITGIAGPGGGTEEKPVGMVYVALVGPGGQEEVRQLRQYARGGRDFIRRKTVCDALDMLRHAMAGISQTK